MAKILSSYFNYYRGEAHYEYMTVYRGKLNLFPPVMAQVQIFIPEFDDLLNTEGQLVDAQKKNPYTALIVEADELDDRLVLGMKESVLSGTRHYDPNIAAAAGRLYDRFKDFGNLEKKSYEEEAAAITILLNDLRSPRFFNDAHIVGIVGWMDQLSPAIDNFKNLLEERNKTIAVTLPKENFQTVKTKINKVYLKMKTRINAAAEVDETGVYEDFIQQLNAEIKYFNEHTHRSPKKDLAEGNHTIIEPVEVQLYTGEAITPIPIVRYQEKGKQQITLTFTEDFSLSYKNNRQPGMAELIVQGKGAYKGKKSTTFKIIKNE